MMETCTTEEVDMAIRSATLDRLHVCLVSLSMDTPVEIFHAVHEAAMRSHRWTELDRTAKAELHRHAGQLVERITHTRIAP